MFSDLTSYFGTFKHLKWRPQILWLRCIKRRPEALALRVQRIKPFYTPEPGTGGGGDPVQQEMCTARVKLPVRTEYSISHQCNDIVFTIVINTRITVLRENVLFYRDVIISLRFGVTRFTRDAFSACSASTCAYVYNVNVLYTCVFDRLMWNAHEHA